MARWPKPAEGSWTQHYPELGTAPVSYEDSISPEHYELERDAIFRRTWLNVDHYAVEFCVWCHETVVGGDLLHSRV